MTAQNTHPRPSRKLLAGAVLMFGTVTGCPALLDDSFHHTEGKSEITASGGLPVAGAAGQAGSAGSSGADGPNSGGTIVLLTGGNQSTGGAYVPTGGAYVPSGGGTAGTGASNGARGGTGHGGGANDGTGAAAGFVAGFAGSAGELGSGGDAGTSPAGGTGGSGTASCTDGIQNQDETGVDCGGVCGASCADGDSCLTDEDCDSGWCNGGALIEFVSATSYAGSASLLSEEVTIGSEPDRMLVVALGIEASSSSAEVVAVSFGGTAMDLAVEQMAAGTRMVRSYLFTLGEAALPAGGTYTLAANLSDASEWVVHVLELRNVADASPEATAGSDDEEAGWSSISTSLTTSTDFAWVVDVVVSGEGITFTTTEPGQIERADASAGASAAAASTQQVDVAGLTTLGWSTDADSNRLTQAAAAFAPSGTAGSCENSTCSDGIHNGDETDVDCGGEGCEACAAGQTCEGDSDCGLLLHCDSENRCALL
jgi:hypothetical protein